MIAENEMSEGGWFCILFIREMGRGRGEKIAVKGQRSVFVCNVAVRVWFGMKRVGGRSKRLGGGWVHFHSVRGRMEESKVLRKCYSAARCPLCPPIF